MHPVFVGRWGEFYGIGTALLLRRQNLGNGFFHLNLHEISVCIGRQQADESKIPMFIDIGSHHDDNTFFGMQSDGRSPVKSFLSGGFVAVGNDIVKFGGEIGKIKWFSHRVGRQHRSVGA